MVGASAQPLAGISHSAKMREPNEKFCDAAQVFVRPRAIEAILRVKFFAQREETLLAERDLKSSGIIYSQLNVAEERKGCLRSV